MTRETVPTQSLRKYYNITAYLSLSSSTATLGSYQNFGGDYFDSAGYSLKHSQAFILKKASEIRKGEVETTYVATVNTSKETGTLFVRIICL